MKKAPTLALLALSGISTASFAEVQNIDIQPGWNLKGSLLDNVDVTEDFS
ncbi:MAG: hypothetical protein GXN97_06970, partial [Aquificae bacterium]|nr:hypothetical protein [Aquificota bacterium]